jgi:choline dehydrogenase-like flavoprotein
LFINVAYNQLLNKLILNHDNRVLNLILNAENFSEPKEFSCDICIVGAGVAGIVVARELLGSNKSIIMMESGHELYNESIQNLYKSNRKPKIFPDTSVSRLRMLGGSSNHWGNSTERLDPIDFEKRGWVPNSGWPFSYSTLEPFYNTAEKYCGVGDYDDQYSLDYWLEKAPFKDYFPDSELMKSAIIKSSLIPVRFFKQYGPDLLEDENVQIISGANITEVDYSPESENISGISFNTIKSIKHTIKAKLFIMCLGGIENARMLLNFNQDYDDRIGNLHGNVGRYLMEHPTIRGAHFYPLNGRLPSMYESIYKDEIMLKARLKLKEETQYKYETNNLRMMLVARTEEALSHGVSSAHILSNHFENADIADNFGTHLVNVLSDIDVLANIFAKQTFDFELNEDVFKFSGYQLVSMIEQTPDRSNRITLSDKEDILGIKKINIDWTISDEDKNLAWRSLDLIAKDPSINRKGRFRVLKERESRLWSSQLGFGSHHIGTTRISSSYKTGVVDPKCRVYGTNNLYIGGSSVFPTGGHVPPTLTIVAMSIKLADDIKRDGLV